MWDLFASTGAGGSSGVTVCWRYWGSDSAVTCDVYRSTEKGAEGQNNMDVPVAAGAATLRAEDGRLSFVDTSVTVETTYYYKIAMVDSGGQGSLSPEISATPAVTPLPPPVLAATAGPGTISLYWTAVPGATSYNVWRLPPDGLRGRLETDLPANRHTDTDVPQNRPYYYGVAAVNNVCQGALSGPASATPGSLALPQPAAAASMTGPDLGRGPTVTVSWTPVFGATGYHLYRSDVGPVGVTTYSDQTQLTDSFYVVPGTT